MSTKADETIVALGLCPRCGGKFEHLFRTPDHFDGGELQEHTPGIVHCGCIWSMTEQQRAIMALKEGVWNLHGTTHRPRTG